MISLVVWNMFFFPYIGNNRIILPIDELIFFKMVIAPPTSDSWWSPKNSDAKSPDLSDICDPLVTHWGQARSLDPLDGLQCVAVELPDDELLGLGDGVLVTEKIFLKYSMNISWMSNEYPETKSLYIIILKMGVSRFTVITGQRTLRTD